MALASLQAMAASNPDASSFGRLVDDWAAPAAAASSTVNAAVDHHELALRQAVLQATWPADLVRLADEYLQHHAQRPWAADASRIRERAALTAKLLRREDVALFRSAFALPSERGLAAEDRRLAALGDAGAALRLAGQAQLADAAGSQAVGWLQFAAMLGSERAAYELALHFRRQAQPLMASHYEGRAAELGFVALPSLDHGRK